VFDREGADVSVYATPKDWAAVVTLLRGVADHDHGVMSVAMNDPDARPWSVAGLIGKLFIDLVRDAHGRGACLSVDELLDSYGLAGATTAEERGQ
jgi:hypothetical protein